MNNLEVILSVIFIIGLFIGLLTAFAMIIYKQFGYFKKFFHDICGFHVADESKYISIDACSVYAICKYCKKHIKKDNSSTFYEIDKSKEHDTIFM